MPSRSVLGCTAVLLAVGGLVFVPSFAVAQSPDGSTDEDETVWTLTAGGALTTGRKTSWFVDAGTTLRLLEGIHSLLVTALFEYGKTSRILLEEEGPVRLSVTVAREFSSRARYALLFTRMDGFFVGGGFRWDPLAGIETQAHAQAGYIRYFVRAEDHRFWGELGYDFTYENFFPDPLVDEEGNVLPGEQFVHSGRLFLGYDNDIADTLTFFTGAELLVSILDPRDTRVRWDNAFNLAINDIFLLGLRFLLLFDNQPVPIFPKLDTTTTLNLVVVLF